MKYVKPNVEKDVVVPSPVESKKLDTTPIVSMDNIPEKLDKKAIPQSPTKEKSQLQEIPVVRVDDKEARKQLISSLKQSEKQKPEPDSERIVSFTMRLDLLNKKLNGN